ncbi:MAG TPA: hypothetical protein VHK65_13905 [Candidatus Dormibacteraeota bacterium]|nr:hypothetical protein [Candidatus Dormibacteraeota bacterium]
MRVLDIFDPRTGVVLCVGGGGKSQLGDGKPFWARDDLGVAREPTHEGYAAKSTPFGLATG